MAGRLAELRQNDSEARSAVQGTRTLECAGSATVRRVRTSEIRFYRRDRDWSERSGCRAITRMRKQLQVRRRSWGRSSVPASRVFSEMYLGHQSLEHGPKASFDHDPPVRP
jgi:hypothetical protein